ncbi:hypothetical protein [Pseudomonas phage PMBT14]|uniref:Uncharacterized protein n=1 Tax=Pseudomonas phage PMBT14 TaxID=2059855 RepID=A0A2I6PI90_9CAUD|nr:hypothetical protein HWB42_gp42 [Pseudomonas phage PMBT14]AUM59759.1 hypothetical protein [Pseudomonas phage PMBT14]
MARTSRNAKPKTNVKVDFTGVEASGNHPEGRFLFTVDGVPEIKTSENSGNDYINWKLKSDKGTVWHMTSLAPQALFNLRNTLESLGVEVEEAAMDLDLTEVDGLTCGGEVEFETYQGKKKSRLIDIFPESELEEAEEEEDSKPKGKGAKAKPEPEPADDELTAQDLLDADKDDLLEIAKDNEVEGITLKLKKDLDALRAHIAEALEIELEEAGAEGSDEPTFESVQEMSKEELVALAGENEIKLTLKQKKDLDGLRDFICEQLELEAAEEEKPKTGGSRRKTGGKELAVKSKVAFVDDGNEMEGVVKSINTKEKFAVVIVDGEEWEVELADLTVA